MCRIPKPSFEELKKYFDTITTLNIFHVHLIDASNIHYYFFQIVKDRQPIAQLLEPRIALTGSIANAQGSGHSEHWALGIGGGRRDRTDDPLLAKQVLSQLSYAPSDIPQGGPLAATDKTGGSGWIRTNDPRLIKTVL